MSVKPPDLRGEGLHPQGGGRLAGLKAALDYLRPGDTLAVWKLDRLGGSVKDVLIIADDLHARGIGGLILTGRLSGTCTPAGEGNLLHHDGGLRRTGARPHPRAHHGRARRARSSPSQPPRGDSAGIAAGAAPVRVSRAGAGFLGGGHRALGDCQTAYELLCAMTAPARQPQGNDAAVIWEQ